MGCPKHTITAPGCIDCVVASYEQRIRGWEADMNGQVAMCNDLRAANALLTDEIAANTSMHRSMMDSVVAEAQARDKEIKALRAYNKSLHTQLANQASGSETAYAARCEVDKVHKECVQLRADNEELELRCAVFKGRVQALLAQVELARDVDRRATLEIAALHKELAAADIRAAKALASSNALQRGMRELLARIDNDKFGA